MSDRIVREQPLALVQRLEGTERRLRAMALRTWPGAVRTAVDEDTVLPPEDAYTVFFEVLELTVPPGRWIVSAECGVGLTVITDDPLDFPVRVRFEGAIIATDTSDGAIIDVDCDLPTRALALTLEESAEFPFTVTADVRFDGSDVTAGKSEGRSFLAGVTATATQPVGRGDVPEVSVADLTAAHNINLAFITRVALGGVKYDIRGPRLKATPV